MFLAPLSFPKKAPNISPKKRGGGGGVKRRTGLSRGFAQWPTLES